MGDNTRENGQSAVIYRTEGPVAELSLNAPPRNLLTPTMRAALLTAMDRALADPEVTGILLRGEGGQFSFGTDLDEAGHETVPTMAELCRRVEASPKCVVALIDGSALGAGLELALAAHYRLATEGARLGMPGIMVGLAPDAGATQRLPRLVGVAEALRILLSGTAIEAARAEAIGLIDGLVRGAAAEALPVARALALEMPVRTTMDRTLSDPAANLRAVSQARGTIDHGAGSATARIIDCVEAAQLLLPDQAMAFEAATATELAALPETEALKHAYRASIRASGLPGALTNSPAPLPESIVVWGAGPGALTLVGQSLARRMNVTLVDPRREVLVSGMERIAAAEEVEVAAGRLTAAERDDRWARLTATLSPDALPRDTIVVMAEGAPTMPDGVTALPLGGIEVAGQGVALFPAQGPGQLAELALAGNYSEDMAKWAVALARRLGWRVAVTAAGGPVGRRLRRTLAASVAAEERAGHDPAAIAAALAGWGLGTAPRAGLPAAGAEGQRIVARCLLALANEGARMIDEGTVRGAMTIDAVAVGSGLFPRHRGGPMFLADRRGLMVVRAGLDELSVAEPALYAPAPLILRLLHDGRAFSSVA